MSEKSSEVGFGMVLAVVLLLFAAPMVGLVLLGVTMYLLRAQGPTQPVYATAMAATGPVAYPTPVATAAPVQAVVAQRTAELIISADNRLALDGQPITEDDLPTELQRLQQADSRPVTVTIMADPDASGETVRLVVDAMLDSVTSYQINPGALPPDSDLPAVFPPSGAFPAAAPGMSGPGADPASPPIPTVDASEQAAEAPLDPAETSDAAK
jgi:hypothetical protein